jgi:hypothetical protein
MGVDTMGPPGEKLPMGARLQVVGLAAVVPYLQAGRRT